MEQDIQKYVQQLQAVLETVQDGKVCYKLASEKVHTGNIKELLSGYSEERGQIASDISAQITKMGTKGGQDDDDENGSVFSRAMLKLKTAFTNDVADEQAALELCRSSDRKCLETFDEILQGEILETELKPFLMTQRYKVSKAFYEIDKLYFDLFKTSPE